MTAIDAKATEATRRRYNRNAPLYDLMEGLVESSSFQKWRPLLWERVEGKRILEIGVGTGKNFPFYPTEAKVTAIDLSDRMLARARALAERDGVSVDLKQMDVQQLEFANGSFDTVVDTFVFCSVPDPIIGLTEVSRVCVPGGKVIMLEHVLHANRILAAMMHLANPFVVRMMGANINRRTVDNVARSGLVVERVTDLSAGIFKLIEARKAA